MDWLGLGIGYLAGRALGRKSAPEKHKTSPDMAPFGTDPMSHGGSAANGWGSSSSTVAEAPPTAQRAVAGAPIRTDPLIRCLAFLCHALAGNWSGVMEPFSLDPRDAVAVNRAANVMAAHAGLHGLRFIIGIGRLEPRRGGLIELRSGQEEVYVDVSTEAGAFAPSLVSVLAHELSHKVLFDRRLFRQDDDVQLYEILTDVTAVYLGFGKLLLNGYEYSTTEQQYTVGGLNTKRSRHRFGYISVDEVAFTHAMTCYARRLRNPDWCSGLSPFASRTMYRILDYSAMKPYFNAAATLEPRRTYREHSGDCGPSSSSGVDETSTNTTPPGSRATQTPTPQQGFSPEARQLRERLLELTYGDERVVRRMVALEQERQVSLEASYRAAIDRLQRDRQ